MTTLKLIGIGDSTGLILPKELLEKLGVSKGDRVTVTETPNGLELTPYDEEFAETMKIAEEIMQKNHDLLRRLAE